MGQCNGLHDTPRLTAAVALHVADMELKSPAAERSRSRTRLELRSSTPAMTLRCLRVTRLETVPLGENERMATEQADGSNYRDDSKTIDEDADGSNYRDDSKAVEEDADGSNYRDDSKGISEVADGSNYREPKS